MIPLPTDEFAQGTSKLKEWGVAVADPAAEFATLDTDNGGKILFAEFADWGIKKHLDLADDDE